MAEQQCLGKKPGLLLAPTTRGGLAELEFRVASRVLVSPKRSDSFLLTVWRGSFRLHSEATALGAEAKALSCYGLI